MTTTAKKPGPSSAKADQLANLAKGLEGVIGGTTSICSIEQDKLIYRGYEIHDLAAHATFEQVAFLLLEGHKPSDAELARFKAELVAERRLPPMVIEYLKKSKELIDSKAAVPMDILRTAVSLLGNLDMAAQVNTADANLRKAKRLTAKIPTIIGHMQNVIDGRAMIDTETGGDPNLDHAANLYWMMTGNKPTQEEAHILDVSLTLYAEHEFNASTFTSRVIAGTLSDMHGAVTGAIAALKGPLHGGANEAAMEMLKEIESVDRVDAFMKHAFETKRKIMGFGHRVYKNGDHRAAILHKLGKAYADKKGPQYAKWFMIGEKVQRIMLEQKNIHPNVDFPCGMTYYAMGIPVPQYTPIFVAARITGWAAHIMEQHADNRLIRPLSIYTGPDERKWNG
jgi:2-methylcitrate synthase/citrate synthase II